MATLTTSLCLSRLQEERKLLRKNRPVGFIAKPQQSKNGELDLMHWKCKIPGPNNSPFEGGLFSLELFFCTQYPKKGPMVKFIPPLFHPNIYQCGTVCLDLLTNNWKPEITISTLLKNLQDFLKSPNIHSPANMQAKKLYQSDRAKYNKKVKAQAKLFKQT